METGLLHLHSFIRWVVVLVMVAGLGYAIYGIAGGHAFNKTAERLTRAFGITLGIQWIVGILVLLVMGRFDVPYRWEHAVTMTGALIVAHLYIPFKQRSAATRYGIMVAIILAVALLVYIGVARLPQGWRMMP